MKVTQFCKNCCHQFVWESQPKCGTIPAGNILLSSAILFTGLMPTKALRMLKALNCAAISRKTFFRYQKKILQPAIKIVWDRQQQSIFLEFRLSKQHLILSGDGRSDSPGHCAKFGSYTVIDHSVNKVIDFKLVQVSCVFCFSLI